jgi:hypothetical protein
VGVLPDRLLEIGRQGEGLLRAGKGRLEAHRPQHPQGVVAHPVQRFAHGPDDAGLEVFSPAEGIEDLPRERVYRDGVDREVPPRQILLQLLPETYLRVPAPLGVEVAPVSRYLDRVAVNFGPDGPEPLADRP